MTTRAQMLARGDAAPVVVLTIDGLGEYDGLWRFCSRRPTKYTSSRLYKDWLGAWPRILEQEAKALGGVATSGDLEIEIVDIDDALIGKLRTEARPQTTLDANQTAAATSITLATSSGIVPGQTVVFVGAEAQLVTGGTGPAFNVTRGALGTDAQAHVDGDPVYLFTPQIYGRRVRMFVTFDDPGYSTSEEAAGEVSGGWSIDGIGLGEGLHAWRFTARSQLRFLDRLLYRRAFKGWLGSISQDLRYIYTRGLVGQTSTKYEVAPHFQDRLFFRTEAGEIMRVQIEVGAGNVRTWVGRLLVDLRGAAGTRERDFEIDDEMRQVYVADPLDGYGSIRYQAPGAETSSFTTGTWIADSHPAVIALALLTSSADQEDDIPDNWSTNGGNFACLPGGVGLGVPVAELDLESFFAVWQRTQGFRLDHFVLDETETGREVLDRLCRIAGYDLRQSGQEIGLDYYRSPLEGEGVTLWDDDVILTEEEDEGVVRPRISMRLDTGLTAGSVLFKLRTSGGIEVESTFTDADFPDIFGNVRGYYESEDQRIEIDAPYVRADVAGAEPEILRQRALQLLYRFRRPLWRVEVVTDLSQSEVEVGSLVQLTHAQMPDLSTGTRGVTALTGKILGEEIEVSEDEVAIRWTLVMSTSSARLGRICPSGMISGVSGNDATIAANRYTDPASRGDLPTSDAAAFGEGDRVRLVSRDGTPVVTTPAYQTIDQIVGNVLTLDGDFGTHASFAAGTVLEYVGRDDQVQQQYAEHVSMADEATLTVGSSADLAWGFAEP